MSKLWRIFLAVGLVLFMVGCDDDDDNSSSGGTKTEVDIDKTVYDFTVPSYQENADCNIDTFNAFCDGNKRVICNNENKVEVDECIESDITAPDCVWYQQKDMPHSKAVCTVADFDKCSSVGKTIVDCKVSKLTKGNGKETIEEKTVYSLVTTVCAKTKTGKEYIESKTVACEDDDTACIDKCKKQIK